MSRSGSDIVPVPRSAGDHAAVAVHAHLRSLILQGTFEAGAELNQVELAPLLGVSRTPLREAIRMLQEEGLVDAQPQKRARVVAFDPEQLEAVYAQRMLLDGLGATLTAPTFSDEQLDELRGLLRQLRKQAAAGDYGPWHVTHKAFHMLMVSNVQPHLERAIMSHNDASERYRILLQRSDGTVGRGASADAEHEKIVEAYARRDGKAAATALAAHLARTALSLIAELSPAYDPAAIRVALAAYTLDAPNVNGATRTARR
jgi:DNA-binding GntR family transcriptional regulator